MLEARDAGATTLDVSARKLQELPPEIGTIETLVRLDVSGNQNERLPIELGRLVNLRVLHVCENGLSELPAALGDLVGLEELCIAGSALGRLPEWLRRLRALRVTLQHNHLRKPLAALGTDATNDGARPHVFRLVPAEETRSRKDRDGD